MTRRAHDFYETAPWQVDALVDNLPELSGKIWEPCVGDGSLLRRLQERRPDLGPFVTNDIQAAKTADFHYDACLLDCWHRMEGEGTPDWIVTNPPFNVEIMILAHAVKFARCGVAVMANVSFTEPTKPGGINSKKWPRGPWLKEHPYQKRITLERYSFTNNGKTNQTTTDWLIWSKVPLAGPFGISAYGYKDR